MNPHSAPTKATTSNQDPIPLRLLDRFHPGSSSLPGRRPYQEDRIFCSPRLRIFSAEKEGESPGNGSLLVGLFAIFDGHLGDSASNFAANSIRERFLHHVHSHEEMKKGVASSSVPRPLLLQEALRDAIRDIDSEFSKTSASQKTSMMSGSTAVVALKVGDQLLVANVGDSKALVCSSCKRYSSLIREPSDRNHGSLTTLRASLRRERRMKNRSSRRGYAETKKQEDSELGLCVREVSSDHRPDKPEEKLRIEASGGFVTTTGSYPRVNGELAVSRSIGDVKLKKFGVISDPEFSDWLPISENERFIVLASDGIFEKVTPQEVCDVIHGIASGQDIQELIEASLMQEDVSGIVALPPPGLQIPVNPDLHVGETIHSIHRQNMEAIATDPSVHMDISHSNRTNTTSVELWHAENIPKGYGIAWEDMEVISTDHSAYIDVCHTDMDSSTSMERWNADGIAASHDSSCIARVMAQVLTQLAFRAGSMDNLSAVVVPLKAEKRT